GAMTWVSDAAENVRDKVLRGGVADLRPVPRTLIDKGPNRSVYRFIGGDPAGGPGLLVPPLAPPPLCLPPRPRRALAPPPVGGGGSTSSTTARSGSPTAGSASSTGSTRCCRGRSAR